MIELTPSTTEGADPANRSSNTVELATNSSWPGLGSKHTKTVARTKFTEAQENTVDDLSSVSMRCDDVESTEQRTANAAMWFVNLVYRPLMMKPMTACERRPMICIQFKIAFRVPNEGTYHRPLGAEIINDECTRKRSGDIEQAGKRGVSEEQPCVAVLVHT